MPLEYILNNLKRELIRTFAVVDEWFDKELSLCNYTPVDQKWTVYEVLEHIMLANQSLLIIIDDGTVKALQKEDVLNAQRELPTNYLLGNEALLAVADPHAFTWQHHEDHQPHGERKPHEIRRELRDQLEQCLITLELLPNGEGLLHQANIPVTTIGALDVYQCLYFLALHAQRHLRQMEKIQKAFRY